MAESKEPSVWDRNQWFKEELEALKVGEILAYDAETYRIRDMIRFLFKHGEEIQGKFSYDIVGNFLYVSRLE